MDQRLEEYMQKIISELHDIALSLRAMSGRNVVKTNEPSKSGNYIEDYFRRSDPDSR